MKALLRVDGGPAVGMGHLVRTRAVGHALLERGIAAIFATVSEAAERWLRARKEDVVRIDAEAGTDEDALALVHIARERDVRLIVTDGYDFRERYLQMLVDTQVPVASIDDLAAWRFPTAFVVNGGLGALALRYQTAPDTRLLVGPRFLPLRPEFIQQPFDVRRVVERVFVCFGGSDAEDHTGQTLEVWSDASDSPACEVVVGSSYPHLDRLRRRLSRSQSHSRIHRDLEGEALAKLIRTCDMAVGSAGMVACELAALGVPSVIVLTAENQRGNAAALLRSGAAVVLESGDAVQVRGEAATLAADVDRRRRISRSARTLLDGLGASRVAAAIIESH